MEFRNHTLKNGLRIVAECNAEAHSAAFGYFVDTGARDESPDVAGVSHFLEHMVFKGTNSRLADDVNREFDEMGAHYNAFTGDEQTVYYASVLPEQQNQAVELLTDIMRPVLRQEDFEIEKQVIIEEIRMYDDQPPFGMDDKCKALYFAEHPLAQSILGTVESINGLSSSRMKEYFQKRYAPNNMVIAASGRVLFDELIAQLEEITRTWQQEAISRHAFRAKGRNGFEAIHRESATQQYVMLMTAAPSVLDEDRYAAKVLTVILGDDQGSRLYWELVDPGLVEGISMGHHDFADCGAYATYLSCSPERTEDNLHRLNLVYETARADGFSEDELELAKSKINSRLVLSSEKPRNRLFAVGGNWLQRGEYRSVRDDLEIVDKLALSDIHDVLEKYPLTGGTLVTVGPLVDFKWTPTQST